MEVFCLIIGDDFVAVLVLFFSDQNLWKKRYFRPKIEYILALLNRSYHIQNKLADYFRRKRSDESASQQSVDKNISDQENRYLKYMANVDELTRQLAQVKDQCNTQVEEMKIKRSEKQDFVNKEWET